MSLYSDKHITNDLNNTRGRSLLYQQRINFIEFTLKDKNTKPNKPIKTFS